MSRAVVDVACHPATDSRGESWTLEEWATVLEVLNDGTV